MLLWFQQITFDTTAVIASFFGVLSAVIAAVALVKSNKATAKALMASNEATAKAAEMTIIINGWKDLHAAQGGQIKMLLERVTSQDQRLTAQGAQIVAQDVRINEAVAATAACEQKHAFLEGQLKGMGVVINPVEKDDC